jgi:hypothetical protein
MNTKKETREFITKIIKEELENTDTAIDKLPKIDLKVGDTILTGKFKNKKVEVKEFGVDDNGQPTVNGRPMLTFRIEKLMPKKEKK